MTSQQFWHSPSQAHLGRALALFLAVSLWFGLIYCGADYLGGFLQNRFRVHFDFELTIPLFPPAILAYQSIYLLFLMAPFVLASRRELDGLAFTQTVVILIGGIGFLVFPVEPAFSPLTEDVGIWSQPLRLSKAMALQWNFLPSLHVALSFVCLTIYARQATPLGKGGLWIWGLAIAASTLLIHAHFLADVFTGWLLALAGVRWVYDTWMSRASRNEANHSGQPVQESRTAGLMDPRRCPRDRHRSS